MATETHLLTGRVALITGASRGIGRAIALRLAQAVARTILAARTEPALVSLAESIQATGTEVLVVPTDVTDDRQLETLVQTALGKFGRIDILVNNAGGGPPRTPVMKAKRADWEWTVHVNLWATMI